MSSYSQSTSESIKQSGVESTKTSTTAPPPGSAASNVNPAFPTEEELRQRLKSSQVSSSFPASSNVSTAPSISLSSTPSQLPSNDGVYLQSGMVQYGPAPTQQQVYSQQVFVPGSVPQGAVYVQPPVSYSPYQQYPQYQQQPAYVQYPQQPQPQYQVAVQPQYMPPQPRYTQPQTSEQRVRCPFCQTELFAPTGVEQFRCPCGQALRNPYFVPTSTTACTTKTGKETKKNDLVDAGLGLG